MQPACTVDSFWVDVTRCTLYVLLPICLVYALFLVWQGTPQTFGGAVEATTLEGARQTIAVGPVASQAAIKMLGTNGGGFFNANAAHPFENPTALSNFVQIVSIFALASPYFALFEQHMGRLKGLLTDVVTGLDDVGDCGCADWLADVTLPFELPGPSW